MSCGKRKHPGMRNWTKGRVINVRNQLGILISTETDYLTDKEAIALTKAFNILSKTIREWTP